MSINKDAFAASSRYRRLCVVVSTIIFSAGHHTLSDAFLIVSLNMNFSRAINFLMISGRRLAKIDLFRLNLILPLLDDSGMRVCLCDFFSQFTLYLLHISKFHHKFRSCTHTEIVKEHSLGYI